MKKRNTLKRFNRTIGSFSDYRFFFKYPKGCGLVSNVIEFDDISTDLFFTLVSGKGKHISDKIVWVVKAKALFFHQGFILHLFLVSIVGGPQNVCH